MRDVIIIGAGGGGGVVAKELAEQGLDVLVLEAGPHRVDTELEYSHYETAATSILRWGSGDPTKAAWRRELVGSSLLFQAAGVGGTTQMFFANSPRAMPGAFQGYSGADQNEYDVAHRFPFTYQELVPYYQWVEATLPVQTAALGTKEEVFIRGAEAMGLPYQSTKNVSGPGFRPQENAILQPIGYSGLSSDPALLQYPLSKGCTYCGHCLQGCNLPRKAPRNLKAKRSTYNSYMPMALTADLWAPGKGRAAQVIADAFVTQILTDSTSSGLKAKGVRFRVGATGDVVDETARVVVMACGAVETPRLWLNSGLPNANGWVGAGLTTHAIDLITAVMPFDTKSTFGPTSAVRADFPGYGSIESFGVMPGGEAAFGFLISQAGIAGMYDNGTGPDASGADYAGRLVGPALKDAMADVDRLATIVVLTDDDVDPQNKVSLSAQPGDEHGAIPKVDAPSSRYTARTRRNREYLAKKSVELLRAAGASYVVRANTSPSLIHMHSTMRMGNDPSNSVVTPTGESRAVQGLYIADNSSLSNAIGGPNPTLTTQAIATRTAESIAIKHFGGRGWVGRGSPVSSVHSRVTNACANRGL